MSITPDTLSMNLYVELTFLHAKAKALGLGGTFARQALDLLARTESGEDANGNPYTRTMIARDTKKVNLAEAEELTTGQQAALLVTQQNYQTYCDEQR